MNISLPANVGPGVNIDCGRCLKDVLIRSFIKGGKNASLNIFKLLKWTTGNTETSKKKKKKKITVSQRSLQITDRSSRPEVNTSGGCFCGKAVEMIFCSTGAVPQNC